MTYFVVQARNFGKGRREEDFLLKHKIYYCRSSRPEVFYKKGVLRNFVKFTEKQLCQSLFFNKFAD